MLIPAKQGFRVVSWNLNGNNRRANAAAWAYLRDVLDADVALVQEADAPDGWEHQLVPVNNDGTVRTWCTGVATRGRSLAAVGGLAGKQPGSYPGALVGSQIELDGLGTVIFLSVHTLVENGLAYPSVHRVLNDVAPLRDRAKPFPVVMGGDLNTGDQLPLGHALLRHQKNLMERFGALGLDNLLDATAHERGPLHGCECRSRGCRHVRTQNPRRPGSPPYQTDYLWASAPLNDRLLSCRVDDSEAASALSDHLPVVADFDLGRPVDAAPSSIGEERLLELADESEVSGVFQAAIELATRHGLGRRTYVDSMMVTPPAHRGKMLVTLGLYGREIVKINTDGEALERYYGIDPARAEEALGGFGQRFATEADALGVIARLGELIEGAAGA